MYSKGSVMMCRPVWQDYLVGEVFKKNLSEDTPKEIRDIYDEYQAAKKRYVDAAKRAETVAFTD